MKKKLTLEHLKVTSFITQINNYSTLTVKGGVFVGSEGDNDSIQRCIVGDTGNPNNNSRVCGNDSRIGDIICTATSKTRDPHLSKDCFDVFSIHDCQIG